MGRSKQLTGIAAIAAAGALAFASPSFAQTSLANGYPPVTSQGEVTPTTTTTTTTPTTTPPVTTTGTAPTGAQGAPTTVTTPQQTVPAENANGQTITVGNPSTNAPSTGAAAPAAAPAPAVAPAASTKGSLPFTGSDALIVLLGGALLAGLGFGLRRLTAVPSRPA